MENAMQLAKQEWGAKRLTRRDVLTTLAALACGLPAACQRVPEGQIPVPKLENRAIELRIAHLINPRLPAFTPNQVAVFIATMVATAKAQLDLHVSFTPIMEMPIERAFSTISRDQIAHADKDTIDPKHYTPDELDSFVHRTALALKHSQAYEPLEGVIRFVQKSVPSFEAKPELYPLARALATLHLLRLRQWHELLADDGVLVANSAGYHRYTRWVALGFSEFPFDFVLTNQMVASAELYGTLPHIALRGGFTNGATSYNPAARPRTYAWWSAYAFLAPKNGFIDAYRKGETYGAEEAAQLAGMAATHELGHQLLHLGHPYGTPSCIMYPAEMLAFRAWAANVNAQTCKQANDPAMKRGVYQFFR
jgi:hypothetical protein